MRPRTDDDDEHNYDDMSQPRTNDEHDADAVALQGLEDLVGVKAATAGTQDGAALQGAEES